MSKTYFIDAQGAIKFTDLSNDSNGCVGNPSSDIEYQKWLAAGNVLGEKGIEQVKAERTASINQSCAAAIVAGFTSSALGSPYTYTATLEDQANLTDLVLIGVNDSYTCIDTAGVKASRPHTIAQLKAVLVDGAASKKAYLTKAATLKAQIAAAVDAAAVGAVIW